MGFKKELTKGPVTLDGNLGLNHCVNGLEQFYDVTIMYGVGINTNGS